ncbi:hypothetical protein EAG_09303 [Camponotus floridanus]|uniref:Uncharacterized protein n=1 Tax=Camponotus floridanus TaxID=104421 RepID=E2A7V0_CAMFO|nr:hypothetical protein EAG_09303 [Camponotus floridanus]
MPTAVGINFSELSYASKWKLFTRNVLHTFTLDDVLRYVSPLKRENKAEDSKIDQAESQSRGGQSQPGNKVKDAGLLRDLTEANTSALKLLIPRIVQDNNVDRRWKMKGSSPPSLSSRFGFETRQVPRNSLSCRKDITISAPARGNARSKERNKSTKCFGIFCQLCKIIVAEVVHRTPHCGRRISAGEFPCHANTVTVHQSGYRIFQLKNPFIPDPPYLRIAV